MKRNFLLFLCAIGFLSYQCAETKKYDDSITINAPEQFLFVGKNKPMITVTGSKVSPVLTLISKGSTDAEIVGSDSIKVSQPGTIKVKITVENATPTEKEFKVVNPNFTPIRMSSMAPILKRVPPKDSLIPTTTPPTMRELGYTFPPLALIHDAADTIGYTKALAFFPQIITSSILYIDNTSKFIERVTLLGNDLLKVGTYITEDIPQTDSIKYTFTYLETSKEDKSQTMIYKQHRTTKEITAIVKGAALIYKKQE